MTEAHEIWSKHRPRVGQPITYEGRVVGNVTSIEGNLCYVPYDGVISGPFIWCFKDSLNNLHDWPTKNPPPTTEERNYHNAIS